MSYKAQERLKEKNRPLLSSWPRENTTTYKRVQKKIPSPTSMSHLCVDRSLFEAEGSASRVRVPFQADVFDPILFSDSAVIFRYTPC